MDRARRYFLNLFTEETWRESRLNARWEYTGHTIKLRNKDVIQPGDVFLCWVTRVSEDPPAWRRGLYPVRYPTKMLRRVPLDEAVGHFLDACTIARR